MTNSEAAMVLGAHHSGGALRGQRGALAPDPHFYMRGATMRRRQQQQQKRKRRHLAAQNVNGNITRKHLGQAAPADTPAAKGSSCSGPCMQPANSMRGKTFLLRDRWRLNDARAAAGLMNRITTQRHIPPTHRTARHACLLASMKKLTLSSCVSAHVLGRGLRATPERAVMVKAVGGGGGG